MPVDDAALQARTSVAAARVGQLTTYARHPSSQHTASVCVHPRPDGTVEVLLAQDAVGVRQLLARPVATLEVAPPDCRPVLLHGAVRRLPGRGSNGTLRFHLDVAAVRVGAPAVLVDERSYLAVTPDPLAHEAPAVLAHLNGGHAEALAACLRAAGRTVAYARATGLDAVGLTVAAVTPDGVDLVRLRFPQRVTALDQLPTSLAVALSPRCGCSAGAEAHPERGDGAGPRCQGTRG